MHPFAGHGGQGAFVFAVAFIGIGKPDNDQAEDPGQKDGAQIAAQGIAGKPVRYKDPVWKGNARKPGIFHPVC